MSVSPVSFKAWGISAQLMGCTHCQSVILHTDGKDGICPYCLQKKLTPIDAGASPNPPEGVLQHQVTPGEISRRLEKFQSEIPFTPTDFNLDGQLKRLRKLYLPMWWIDVPVKSPWQAEVGLEYTVSSHQEVFKNDRWSTIEKTESRVDWETRFGQIDHTWDNIPAPALTYFRGLETKIGEFYLEGAQPYAPEFLEKAEVLLPDHSTEDAWREATYLVEAHVKEQCQVAAEGVGIRNFQWTPEWGERNWTHLLLPIYTTYYLDDEGEVCPLYIHGQTGHIYGRKQASLKRANKRMQALISGAVLLLILAILPLAGVISGDLADPLPVFGGIGGLMLVLIGIQGRFRAERFNEIQQSGFLWSGSS